jgi:hypothetical protein
VLTSADDKVVVAAKVIGTKDIGAMDIVLSPSPAARTLPSDSGEPVDVTFSKLKHSICLNFVKCCAKTFRYGIQTRQTTLVLLMLLLVRNVEMDIVRKRESIDFKSVLFPSFLILRKICPFWSGLVEKVDKS